MKLRTRSLRPLFSYATLLFLACNTPSWAGTSQHRPSRPKPHPTTPETDPDLALYPESSRKTSDPLEPLNRGIFAFNHQAYRWVFRPLAKATEAVVPKTVLDHLGNVFVNLETPGRVVSSLLQGNVDRAGRETSKMLINSTVGVGGLFKPSDRLPCLAHVPAEDIGQAFGKWGVSAGPYLVVPILGPSSCRDLTGKAADTALIPTTWLRPGPLRNSLWGTRTVQENPGRMNTYDQAREGALDEYIAVREAFLSYRAEAIRH
ncbi:MAG: hypothetical protein RLZZ399_990 [Verrucomicrobiota bacterium]|jgi:phospholipid-binding lipoprotein MlaA